MYEIAVVQHFDAAHFLREYHGKCEALHGHRYQVIVKIQAPALDNTGLAYDFTELKKHLRNIIDRFDHACLNDLPPFDNINPSAENIATNIYQELKPKIAATVSLTAIEVWETPDNRATYFPDLR
ncbi:MAG: 6-carboxytetrahydropterin synthase QueD [Chloroflexi bacterium]|nr:6-carboxytetrahydropterin synthase QueD [Chloroflexota bacterium]MBI4267929.1 6-carboxytetrahydropterin synthase QueD [Chloroflexota bacterium]